MTIAWVFYAAISIYLSGIYDYSHIWVENGIFTPTISDSIVDQHVSNILDITTLAVERKNLAGVLFLFPLRIAGARAHRPGRRVRIQNLILQIAGSFRAANAILTDLQELWANPESYANK
jgi:hypothetical protein